MYHILALPPYIPPPFEAELLTIRQFITSETPPKESKYLGELIRTRFNIAKDPELAKKFKKNLSDLAGQGLVEGKV